MIVGTKNNLNSIFCSKFVERSKFDKPAKSDERSKLDEPAKLNKRLKFDE